MRFMGSRVNDPPWISHSHSHIKTCCMSYVIRSLPTLGIHVFFFFLRTLVKCGACCFFDASVACGAIL